MLMVIYDQWSYMTNYPGETGAELRLYRGETESDHFNFILPAASDFGVEQDSFGVPFLTGFIVIVVRLHLEDGHPGTKSEKTFNELTEGSLSLIEAKHLATCNRIKGALSNFNAAFGNYA